MPGTQHENAQCLNIGTLENHEQRIRTMEDAVVELKEIARKNDEQDDKQDVDISAIKASLEAQVWISRALMVVSIVAFFGMIITYVVENFLKR